MIFKAKGNELYMYGIIFKNDGRYFIDEFSRIDGTYPIIKVRLHTDGGSVFDGNLIYNALLNAKSEIHIYIDGIAASMGAIIMLSGKKIFIAENGFAMIHSAAGSTWGTAKDHENTANLLREVEKSFVKKLIAKTGKEIKEINKWFDGDNWFSAEQALKAKLVDGVIDNVISIDTKAILDDKNISNRYESYSGLVASLKSSKPKEENLLINHKEMKLKLIQGLGLTSVNEQSSDTAVLNAVKEHYEAEINSANKKYEDEKKAKETLETAVKAQKETQIDALIAKAGKLSDKQKETYKKIGQDSGLEVLGTILSSTEQRVPISSKLNNGGGSGKSVTANRSDWDWDKYQKEAPRALEQMQKEGHVDHDAFLALYEAKFDKPFKA